MNFERGQWYRTGLERRAEILAVDSVRIGREEGEVIAYRYEGKDMIHMRSVELTNGWVLDTPLAVGDEVRYKQITCGVRVGSAERRVVTYVSDHLVCFDVFASDGRLLAEHSLSCTQFHADFERDPE